MKYSKIISYARTCIANSEKYKKANVGEFSEQTLAYVFSKSILNPKQNIQVKGIPANENPILGDVDGGIGIKNFQKLCQLYINSCDKKGKAPSYLLFNGFKIGVKAWAYATARVVVYNWEKKKLPNKVITTYKPFYVAPKPKPEPKPTYHKYGHATEYGCNNRGQNNGHYCGPHSLQEVFRNLTGIVVSQDTIAKVAGTTYDGTDHDGLNTVVAWFNRTYNKNLQVTWYNFSELGWDGVRNIINSDNQDCVIHNLYRRDGDFGYGHYETVNRIYDDYCDVQNSLGDYCDYGCYCGYVEERDLSTFKYYMDGISQKSVMVITNESD